ncbi:MAG: ADOP family duplicated permease [Vicinamibacterales bacterium]
MIRRMQEAFSRLAAVFRRSHLDRDLDEELAAHLALLMERNQQRGVSHAEARRQAILQIGGLNAARELHREARGMPRVESVIHACHQAWRSVLSAKGVALLTATALALGIGSATAIYSVVHAVMLKPLPYRDGERFVALFAADVHDPARYSTLTSDDARVYEERTRAFDAFGWFREAGKNLTFAGEPHHVHGVAVTIPLVQHLGVQPLLGQWFRDESGTVISRALWQRLGGNPAIIGQALTLDGRSYTVTGVMPGSFHLPVAGITSGGSRADVWMPLDPREQAGAAYVAYARLRPDVSFESAEADVKRVAAQIGVEDPQDHRAYTARLFELRETVIRDIRPTLLLLLSAAGLLFLITCANAAGLLLARSVARARETAMRVALGASRGQLAALYLAEALLISLVGAAGGVFLALIVTPAIVSLAANYLPRAEEIAVDWSVLLFALGAAVVASVLSILAPLRQALRLAPADALGEGVRASARRRSRRASQSLVVVEIALAFSLLAVSSILIGHLRNLSRVSPGFQPDHLLTFVISLPGTIVNDADTRRPVQQKLVDSLRTIPGVEDVAFARSLPFKDCCWPTTIYAEGSTHDRSPSQPTSLMAVSVGYFQTMRIPLRRGRFFADSDLFRNPPAVPVVLSETAAMRYWGEQNPVGAYGRFDTPAGRRFQVVGVAGDVRNDGLTNPSVPEVYMPAFYVRVESMKVLMRSATLAASLLPEIRRMVRSIDPGLPVFEAAPMREVIRQTITLERSASFLTAFFAGAALLMAMVGVYGVVAYSVRQRTVEIGVRMALGATSRAVLSMIVGAGLRMAGYGVVAGGILAFAGASYLGRVFQIGELGPAPFAYSAAIVAALAFVASLLPAWRAALLSPLLAIRNAR